MATGASSDGKLDCNIGIWARRLLEDEAVAPGVVEVSVGLFVGRM